MEQSIEFKSKKSQTTLRGRFIKAASTGVKQPLVFMLTGDGGKGTKSLSWVNMPPKLQEFGISSFLFDFEGLGYSEGKRGGLNISKGIDNLISAFEVIQKEEWVDKDRIGCFAASFGATILLLNPEIANKLSVIGLKSPAAFIPDAYYNELGHLEYLKWRDEEYSELNGYNYNVIIDALKYNVFTSAQEITSPVYITQGDKDEIVPFHQSYFLFDCLGSQEKELEIFPDGNHGYSNNNDWDKMAQYFVNQFNTKLNAEN